MSNFWNIAVKQWMNVWMDAVKTWTKYNNVDSEQGKGRKNILFI